MEKQIAELQRAARLSSASLDDTALLVRDESGSLRGIVGQQGDGTTAVTIVNGPPPPQPSAPIVVSVLGGVAASWDGSFTDGQVLPLDWSRTEVHASPDSSFAPASDTLQSTIETAQGATVVVPADGPVYVRLVARSTSGTASAPSLQAGPYGPMPVVAAELLDGIVTTVKLAEDAVTAAKLAAGAVGATALADGAVLAAKLADAAVAVGKIASGAVTEPAIAANAVTAGKIDAGAVTAREIAAGAVTTEKLIVTGGAELLADPSFEGAATANLVAGNAFWAVDDSKGNGSPKSLRVNAAAGSPTNRDLALFDMAALPGDQLAISVDYQASSDYVGTPRIYARWENSSGGFLSAGAAQASPPVTGASWQTISATITAPSGAARYRLNLASTSGVSGQLWFDNASVRSVLAGTQIQNGAVTTPKIVAGAVQAAQIDAEAVNASKIASGAVTTAKLDALAVTADKIAANTITTGKLAAGSVDATALKADAITGKVITGGTITGAIVQTGTSGARIVLDTNHLGILDSASSLLAEIEPADPFGRARFITYDKVGATTFYSALSAANVAFGIVGQTPPSQEGRVSFSDLGGGAGLPYELSLSSGNKDWMSPALISLYSERSVGGGDQEIVLNANHIWAIGRLTAGNIRSGQVTITPTAANTPASVTVTGLAMSGTNPRAIATPRTTGPGTVVLGVGCGNVTTDSLTVWATRTSVAATNIDYIVIAS
ncbi:hypothetical protein [Streptomyces sp. NPDC007346]|uniref:hypothetical protein n=1 Tax=Streptomyces sp. NPDC007346 TaxID=3154682 RepID=UPI00345432CB